MNAWDEGLFRAINQWPAGQAEFWRFLSSAIDLPAVRVVLGLLVVGLLIAKATRWGAWISALGWLIANEATDIVKGAWPMARPCQELAGVVQHIGCGASMGTASAHSANMACIAACFCWHYRWWGSPWVAVALLVGVSRVYVGAHYPSQVLLGWLVGAAVGLGWCWLWDSVRAWQRRRRQARQAQEEAEPTPVP